MFILYQEERVLYRETERKGKLNRFYIKSVYLFSSMRYSTAFYSQIYFLLLLAVTESKGVGGTKGVASLWLFIGNKTKWKTRENNWEMCDFLFLCVYMYSF